MTEAELNNLLVKVSVQAIFDLSDGNTDPIAVQEIIERNSYFRPVLSPIQIFEVQSSPSGYTKIKFLLSPDFLIYNINITINNSLDKLIWTFELPPCSYGEEDVLVDDASGTISMRSEEGVVEWLMRGVVEIVSVSDLTYQLELETLYHSLIEI
jgi:hypothetical protein